LVIKNKVVIVTGAANGLGLVIAKSLHASGAIVCILDKDETAIQKLSIDFDAYCVDLTDEAAVWEVIDKITFKHGEIHILVNNAGLIHNEAIINPFKENMRHSYDNFRRILRVNLDTVFITSSLVIEKMVKRRTQGVIVNITSISSKGNSGQTAYSAAKAAVLSMTKTWSKELGPYGIRSIAVSPGFMETESTHVSLNKNIVEHLISMTPLRKLGDKNEIARTVIFAIENSYLNGSEICVDGGLVI
jgi:3-oxoacyl-[acyl-carrier protein] reductase